MVQSKVFALFIAILMISAGSLTAEAPQVHAQAPHTLHTGSSGGDVWDLQYRLRELKDYQRTLDGKYGPATASAVRKFQSQYGLTVDGITSVQTWSALKKVSLDQPELTMLARIIYSEARGESYTGQVGVGAVVMNRLQSNQFPNNIHDIIFQSGAFSSVSDGQYWLTPNAEAYTAALEAVRGWDPTHGALYYFNPQTATSSWIWSRPETVQIDHHIFSK